MPGDDQGAFKKIVKAMEKMRKKRGFDLTLLFNASLPFGRVILPLAHVNSALGLWSIPGIYFKD